MNKIFLKMLKDSIIIRNILIRRTKLGTIIINTLIYTREDVEHKRPKVK